MDLNTPGIISPELAFIILGLTILIAAVAGILRYKTPLNSLTVFAGVDVGVFMFFSGIVATYLMRVFTQQAPKYSPEFTVDTAMLSVTFLIGGSIPYLIRWDPLAGIYGRCMRLLQLTSVHYATTFDRRKFVFLMIAAVGCLFLLAVAGGGGLKWLTDPRTAYVESKSGSIPIYAAFQWCLLFGMLYYLWSKRPTGWKFVRVVLAFTAASVLTGSKGLIVLNLVVAVIYYNYRVKSVPLWIQLLAIPVMVALILLLIVAQGTSATLAMSVLYFQDYFDSTAWFLSRFDEFGFRYGGAALSYLWFLVPRAIYPDKPYYWGYLLINQVLYPGLAEQGLTPANLSWSTAYLDFGMAGVFVAGLSAGVLRRTAYEYYLRHKDSFFAFTCAIHLGILPIYAYATTLALFAPLMLAQAVFLRLRIVGFGPPRGSAPVALASPVNE